MAFRFVHTADIHLDSPLKSLALLNSELSELIGLATRRSFVQTIDLCLEERVDALIIAGDLYDGEQTSMKTARFLAEQLGRLHQAGIRTYIIRGNHDALSKITAQLVMPDSVRVFGEAAEVVTVERSASDFDVAIHGMSFAKPHAPESLLRHFALPTPDAVNIGIMHTSLNGSPGHDPYAPCSVAELKQTGFQYWALGHIHKRAIFEDKSSAIVMPGIPQGRDINEDGSKTVTLVTVNDDRTVVVEERTTAVARFERLQIDVSDAADWEDVVAISKQKLGQHASEVSAQQIVTRVEVIGSSELAWRVRRDVDVLRTELETHGSLLGNLWVEKVKVSSARPRQIAGNFGPVDELANIIEQEIHGSVDFNTEMKAIADELRSQLPTELRGIFGNDQEAFESLMARSANEGTAQVLARLQNIGGE
ncbi:MULTISPECIES: metallophosphoesterase family protein [unclassified Rhizobium]|jgi:DNA repair exonuclease SbcCD nuclease subunit|uniref:metallophosphoesterase family protein n=1 Tax=unclassified Rhizobium TaxID=2613769 RepID=UPI0025F35B3B|nr:DNA repair exonuclease [Rhizobium sp. UBA1881]